MSVSREVDKRGNRTKRERRGYKPSLQRRGYVTGYTLAQSDFPIYRKALASSNGLRIWLLQATSFPYYRERSIWSICPVTNGGFVTGGKICSVTKRGFVTGGNICSVTKKGFRHRRKSLLCDKSGYVSQKEISRIFLHYFSLTFSRNFVWFCLMKTKSRIHYFIRITIH